MNDNIPQVSSDAQARLVCKGLWGVYKVPKPPYYMIKNRYGEIGLGATLMKATNNALRSQWGYLYPSTQARIESICNPPQRAKE